MEYEHGVFHPRGGCGAIMETMARLARKMGVQIKTDEPVVEILFDGRKATGVRTPRAQYHADALVINADFAQTMSKLVPDKLRRRWRDAKLKKKKFSCSTFMMYLGLEGRFDHLAHHTVLLSEEYARNLHEIEEGRVLPSLPSLYVQNACVSDPRQAPRDMSTLYVLVPVGHDKGFIDWRKEQVRFRAMIVKRLELLGVEDLERRIRFEKLLTPPGWEHDMQVYRGATFNLTHSMNQMLRRHAESGSSSRLKGLMSFRLVHCAQDKFRESPLAAMKAYQRISLCGRNDRSSVFRVCC